MKPVIVALCLCFSCLQAQVFRGLVLDGKSKQPVAFATAGFHARHIGTLSNEAGEFDLRLPFLADTDTLKINAIGYETVSLTRKELTGSLTHTISLQPLAYDLAEVKVKPVRIKQKVLGTSRYSKANCSAFIGEENNWKGEQAAILVENRHDQTVFIDAFNFYIIKNEYADSLRFRVMLYEVGPSGYPSKIILRKPVVFKTNLKQGEVHVDLGDYNISVTGSFFISLECLEDKMEAAKFCFAGSYGVPSFYKTSVLGRWGRAKGGGADLNVNVSYLKN